MRQFPITIEAVRAGTCETPRHGREYLCPFGSYGVQRCQFVGYLRDDFLVRKLLARSGRWTKPVVTGRLAACT